MNTFRIALANLRFRTTREESVKLAIAQASTERAGIICFPECFIPGYRLLGKYVPPPNLGFLEFRRPCELIPRESGLVPRRREHLLVRNGKLCQYRVANHFGRGAARRDAAQLSAIR